MTNKRISEIIREEIDALDFFQGLNDRSNDLTPWDSEGKMDRMQPSQAARSKGSMPPSEVNYHSYADWLQNWKPRGISYSKYMQMEV